MSSMRAFLIEVTSEYIQPWEETQQLDKLPQKRYYRQRAHCNPLSDLSVDHPISPSTIEWDDHFSNEQLISPSEEFVKEIDLFQPCNASLPRFADLGCGYGGMLFTLSEMFPNIRTVGMEIRLKVYDYVIDKISSSRSLYPGKYGNICCVRTNIMKYLPNYFRKAQLSKMFFLYPDPHFKKVKNKWRVISSTLLSEYAYVLAPGARVYTTTDVEDVYQWMNKHFIEHSLFRQLSNEECDDDRLYHSLNIVTEEGQKVCRNNGSTYPAIYERLK